MFYLYNFALTNLLLMGKVYLQNPDLSYLGLKSESAFYQLGASALIEHAILNGEGTLADSGALAIDTGKFTGRSPKDRYVVCDAVTADTVWWGDVNFKFDEQQFDQLYKKTIS